MLWWWSGTAMAGPVEIEAGTLFPIEIGAGVRAEWPGRVQTAVRVGGLPAAYVDVFNATAMAFDAYGDATAEIIRSTIGRSLLVSADVGWRPLQRTPGDRFTFQVGYTLAALGGDTSGAELLTAASGVERPSDSSDEPSVDLSATVHLLRPEVVYVQPLTGRLGLIVGLGAAFTLSARSSVAPTSDAARRRADAVWTEAAAGWLGTTLQRYVHTPTARVGLACSD